MCWDKAKQLNLIEGGSGDGWSEEDVKKLRASFEKFSYQKFDTKWKSVSETVGKSIRQCMIKAMLIELDTQKSKL